MDKIKAAIVGGVVSNSFSNIEDRPEMETNVLAELIPNYQKNKQAELEKDLQSNGLINSLKIYQF